MFTREQQERAVQMYQAGQSISSVCREFVDVSRYRIEKVLAAGNVERHPTISFSRRAFTPDQDREIAGLYTAGLSSIELVQRFGATKDAILASLHRSQVTFRKQQPTTSEAKGQVVRLYAEGVSRQEIARRLGMHVGRVTRTLTESGIQTFKKRPRVGAHHHAWKGGHHLDQNGYRRVRMRRSDPFYEMCSTNGYVMEHRLVVAQSLGRPLTRSETVHHKNGDRADNRIENLELRRGKHGAGSRYRCRVCGSHDIEAVSLAR
jgi:transposase-like protein